MLHIVASNERDIQFLKKYTEYTYQRSALWAASQLPGEGTTDVEDAPAPAC